MEVLLLHNARAGDGEHSRESLVALLRGAGFSPVYRDLHSTLGTSELRSIGEFVIAAGGDGSIRQVALALLGQSRALAPLPLGTANNLATSFGLDAPIEQLVRRWSAPLRRHLDVGYLTGPWGRRPFVEGVGLGLLPRMIAISEYLHSDGEAIAKPPREHKLPRDRAVLAALAHEVAAHPTALHVDDRDLSGPLLLLELLNIPRAGPGVVLAPDADPFDGALDVVAVGLERRPELQHVLRSAIDNGCPASELRAVRGRHIRLVAPGPELRVDDEILPLAPGTPLEIEIAPAALELVLPGPAA